MTILQEPRHEPKVGPVLRGRGREAVAEQLQNERLGNVEQVLDESSRWQEDLGFIVMFRFDYGATRYGRPGTAEPKPPEQVALRRADRPILRWWSFLFLVSVGNLVLWVVIAREM